MPGPMTESKGTENHLPSSAVATDKSESPVRLDPSSYVGKPALGSSESRLGGGECLNRTGEHHSRPAPTQVRLELRRGFLGSLVHCFLSILLASGSF